MKLSKYSIWIRALLDLAKRNGGGVDAFTVSIAVLGNVSRHVSR
ncbi:hypothetical protein QYZ45_17760 [Vibrio parahaemolyticus]|nr:hypothetical protein [Vibrio parahaemolyticus]MDN4695789.1 hypothetical protein [Vibrio parahaemolyticus]